MTITSKPSIIDTINYAKSNNIKTGNNIEEFAKAYESKISDWLKSLRIEAVQKESVELQELSNITEAQQIEMMAHLDKVLKDTETKSKALLATQKEQGQKALEAAQAKAQASQELTARILAEAKQIKVDAKVKVLKDTFAKFATEFGEPGTAYRTGRSVYFFATDMNANKWGRGQLCISFDNLKAKGSDFYIRGSGFRWNESLIETLKGLELSLLTGDIN